MKMIRRQRGVAVITALLLTTLAVTIVASLFWQQQVQVRSMENQRLHLQTKWILRGALDWAALILRQDGRDNNGFTSLDQVWATPLAETRLDQYIERERVEGEVFDATLSGSIIDATSRYNLRKLAKNRTRNDKEVQIYARLLTNLKLDPALAVRTADAVAAGQPPGPTDPPLDGSTPKPATPPSSAPMELTQLDDLLAIPGYTVEMVAKLRDFAIVLPETSKVNVNTAPPEVLAAVIADFSLAEANSLVARRKRSPWRDLAHFGTELGGKQADPEVVDVVSNYYLVRSRVRLDRAALNAEALVSRQMDARRTTTVIWVRQN